MPNDNIVDALEEDDDTPREPGLDETYEDDGADEADRLYVEGLLEMDYATLTPEEQARVAAAETDLDDCGDGEDLHDFD